jgi:NADPH:quinone reductase-like Zn-dependent oxidoreductase
MKAILCPTYGSPDVLILADVDKPRPTENELLVEIHAASANPLDWHRMRGAPFLVRAVGGLQKPKNSQLGADIAGVVAEVGSGVTQFKLGDEVFGSIGAGSFAEYAVARESALVLKPANISFEAAAAVPVAAITALQGLRDAGHIQPGRKVLINGASGGVGTFAVQLAKYFGADVTGVCSTRNLELVRSIGADRVIDYTREDFTKNDRRYDLILDTPANHSASEYARALNPRGQCVMAGFSSLRHLFIQSILMGSLLSKTGDKKIGLMSTAKVNQADLAFLAGLLADVKVVPVIDRCYPLTQTADAIRYLEAGHARGKVVIIVEPNT